MARLHGGSTYAECDRANLWWIMIRGLHGQVSKLVSTDSSKLPMRTDLMMSHWRRLEVLIAAVCFTWAIALTKTTEGARWGL